MVRASSKLHLYTKRQVDTWQSLPELTPEIGDFTSDHAVIPNVLGAPTSGVSSSSLKLSLKASKGVQDASSTSGHTSASRVVSFQDQNISRSDLPQLNEWAMPESVDLHSSGLQRSSRLDALHLSETIKELTQHQARQSYLDQNFHSSKAS